MTYVMKDMERPLGQSLRAARTRGRFRLDFGTATLSLVALCLVGTSGMIALRDRPYRAPVTAAVAVPETATEAKVSALAPVATEGKPAAHDGPSIIKINPGENSGSGVVIIRDPSAVGQNLRIAHLPDKELIEETDIGPLPVRAADGRRPFDVYARPWSGARGARIAIVIGGFGLSQTGTQAALAKLPPEVTLGFAPQGNSLSRWMQTARRDGHEIVMQLPLEPFDYPNVNPGRNTLTVAASAEENADSLHWTLSRTTNYTGVMNYMGARFTSERAAMEPLMAELGTRGLMYLDDGSSARTMAPELALMSRVPFAAGDATIDAVRERGAILEKLDELERIARAKGSAIGTASAFDVSVDTIANWVGEAKKRGIEIVPISALAADPERG